MALIKNGILVERHLMYVQLCMVNLNFLWHSKFKLFYNRIALDNKTQLGIIILFCRLEESLYEVTYCLKVNFQSSMV